MINVRSDNKYKLLYDYEISKENAVKIEKLKEGEKPSLISDTMFHTMFFNEKRLKYSAKLISYYLDVSYEKLLNNMVLSKSELDKYKNDSKGYRTDFVATIDDTRINIEVNNNSDEVSMKRNIDYVFKIYGSSVKRSKDKKSYKYNQVCQININNFSFKGYDEIVDIYSFNSVKNKDVRLTNDVIIIQIYIPNLRKKWYDKGIEKLTEEERYLLALIETDISSSKELGKEIEIMEEYIDEVEEVVDDEYFGESYDKELAWKEECYNDGLKDGIKSNRIQIAKNMLKKNLDINLISEVTSLSVEDIEKL